MTGNCDQSIRMDFSFGERLFRLLFELSLNVFIAYFSVRVVWDIFTLSYSSIGVRGTLYLIFSSIIYFVLQVVTKPNKESIDSVTGQKLMLSNYLRRYSLSILITLFLPIVGVILAVRLEKSQQAIQVFPLRIFLLSSVFVWILHFIQFVLKSIQRKLKTGSILPSAEMCNCCNRGKSSQQIMSLTLGLSMAPIWILYATLLTTLLVFHCYQRPSFLNQSVWVMTDFWLVVLGAWFAVVVWTMSVVRSVKDHRKSYVSSDL